MKELPLDIVRWLVIVVVVYTSLSMLWNARGAKSLELLEVTNDVRDRLA